MMHKKPLTALFAVALGTTLYGAHVSAAPPPSGGTTAGGNQGGVIAATIPTCAKAPTDAQCGDPDFAKSCPASNDYCSKRNVALANGAVSAPSMVPNKLFGTNDSHGQPTKGFLDSAKSLNYGISLEPYAPATVKAPKSQNPRLHPKTRGAPSPSTANRWAGQEVKARVAALTTPSSARGVSLPWQRHTDAPGDTQVGSCEDYVYKGFLDDERWLDAIYGCKGDARCETLITSRTSSPGIAKRTLVNPLMVNFVEFDPDFSTGERALGGKLPRNAFYAQTGAFITPSFIEGFFADPKKQQSLQALGSALRDQFSTYSIGGQKNVGRGGAQNGPVEQDFADEWDFHVTMEQRTLQNTQGEFDEFKRRNDNMLAAMDRYLEAVKCAQTAVSCLTIPSAVGRVRPGETQMWENDMFVSRAVYGNVNQVNATNMAGFVSAHPGMLDALNAGAHVGHGLAFPGLGNRGMVQLGSAFQQSQIGSPTQLRSASMPNPFGSVQGSVVSYAAARLANGQTSPAVDNAPWSYLQAKWKQFPPRIDTSVPYPHLVCQAAHPRGSSLSSFKVKPPPALPERFVGELAACEATNVLLEEWAKHMAGDQGPTCLDNPVSTHNYACDWSPDGFVKRWVNNMLNYNMQAKERAYSQCRMWQSTLFSGGPLATPQVTLDTIKAKEVQRGKDLAGLPVKQTDVFGQDLKDHQTWGGKNFGVGYGYDLGWEAKVFQRFQQADIDRINAPDPKHPQIAANMIGIPCNMGGRMHMAVEADAYAFGTRPFNVVEANFAVDVADDEQGHQTTVAAAYGKGDFLEGAYDFYDIPRKEFQLNQTVVLAKKHDGDEETLVTIPVQISWVTLTFTIGVGWGYGAEVSVTTAAPPIGQCGKDPSLFNVTGAVTPEANLDLIVGADCSIAGIAGVGVDVDLEILKVGLPLRGGARLFADSTNKLNLGFDASLAMALGTLDGHMDAYAKFIGIKLFEVELFHWKGLHTEIPIFHFKSRSFPLFDLGAAAVLPPSDPNKH
jgi:hypothetical protein